MKKLTTLLVTVILMSLCTPANAQKKFSFRGRLGDNIMFRLDLEMNKDSIVAGETTYYRKNGKIAKIPVYGRMLDSNTQCYWNGNALSLTEYNGISECGHFMIALSDKDKVVEGLWAFGIGEDTKSYDICDVETTIFPAGTTYFHPAKGAEMNGEYGWGVLASGGQHYESMGTCELTYKAGNKVHYNFSVVLPGIAEDENTVPLKGSYFDSKREKYKFRAYIDQKFIYVWSSHFEPVEDWGAWANLDGFYLKKQ